MFSYAVSFLDSLFKESHFTDSLKYGFNSLVYSNCRLIVIEFLLNVLQHKAMTAGHCTENRICSILLPGFIICYS